MFLLWTITENVPAHILSNVLILSECELESAQTESELPPAEKEGGFTMQLYFIKIN